MNNRVWVYLSEKPFDAATASSIKGDLENFLKGWNAHGTALSASAQLLHDHFIIIKADEEKFAASGCSIDKQFQFIKEVEKKYGLSLLNRLVIAYKDGNEIKTVHSSKVPVLLAENTINENTTVFNVGVGTDAELAADFEIPLSKSWLAKFLVGAK
ncbi:MAG: ABC transporter ATPase [Bacteroidia bacterium]